MDFETWKCRLSWDQQGIMHKGETAQKREFLFVLFFSRFLFQMKLFSLI